MSRHTVIYMQNLTYEQEKKEEEVTQVENVA
jgi:hypothetical protein